MMGLICICPDLGPVFSILAPSYCQTWQVVRVLEIRDNNAGFVTQVSKKG